MAEVDFDLNSGYKMPAVGYGTWTQFDNPPGKMLNSVKVAMKAGYRLIDTARVYGTEPQIGEALQECYKEDLLQRKDLFITSKVRKVSIVLWATDHQPERVEIGIRNSLEALQTDYLDLYLMHFPVSYQAGDIHFPKDAEGKMIFDNVDIVDTWKAMEDCVKKGLTRSIGVSNFTVDQMSRICAAAEIQPANLQIELNAYCMNDELVNFAKEKKMTVTSYGSIGAPGRPWRTDDDPYIMGDPVVVKLGEKYNKTPAQVLLRFLLQKEIATIPKSVTPSRIEENIKISDFELTAEEVAEVAGLNRDFRMYLEREAIGHPEFPFKEFI